MKDYYAVLGVARDASQATIKRAYRKLARELHPDVNPDPDAAERLKAITEAYATLSDPVKRKEYDEARASVQPNNVDQDSGSDQGRQRSGPAAPRFGPDSEYPGPTAPYDVAQQLYADHALSEEKAHLMAWRGGWMAWRTTCWVEIDVAELRQAIYAVLSQKWYWHATAKTEEPCWWSPNKHKVADVLEALAAVVHVSSEIDPPSWVKDSLHSANVSDASQMISCLNGLLDLSTRTLIDHTPELFNLVSVPFDYDSAAPKPTGWMEFLASVWGDDQDSIMLLQEYFGYVLSGRLDMQKMLMLIGPIRSGKGTVARTLSKLMGGRRNVAGPTLASLGTNFGLSSLLGKPLAIISDARLGTAPSHVVVERLLSITGEDMLDVDRKFRDVWTGKLPTRFVILSNELPKFKDSSGAIATRMLILRMTESFLNHEDHDLENKLAPELGGILAWALEGLDRLHRNGRFTVPKSSRDAAALMMDLASPVSAFVREKCERKPDATVARDELYAAWKEWAEVNGHHSGAKSTFGRDLRAVVPEVGQTQPLIRGRQVWCYTHIGLLPVLPVYEGENTGQSDSAEPTVPVYGPVSDQLPFGDAGPYTGWPDPPDDTKPQIRGQYTGNTGNTTNVGSTSGNNEHDAAVKIVAEVLNGHVSDDRPSKPRGRQWPCTPPTSPDQTEPR